MCIKLPSKTLNPKAKEWRPAPKQPQPLPPPQTAAHAAAFNPTPLYYHPVYHQGVIQYSAYTQCRTLIYDASFPPAQDIDFCKAAMTANSILEVEKTSFTERKKMEGPSVKRLECPPVDHAFKGQGFQRGCPPRFRSLRRRVSVDKPPPAPPPQQQQRRREWRPRKSEKADCKPSGNGGAAHLPPPSGDRCRLSHSKSTTVMIKNIPNRLRRDFMLKFLDDYCKTYSLEYDFLYLPIDFRKKGNLGYAFVNFTSAVAAIKFKNILQNFKWGVVYDEGHSFNSNKICDVTWARIQGKKALIERFQKSSFVCDTLDFLPVILDPPRNGSDPNPSPPVILGSLDRSTLTKIG